MDFHKRMANSFDRPKCDSRLAADPLLTPCSSRSYLVSSKVLYKVTRKIVNSL
jgi:hypothetical protein